MLAIKCGTLVTMAGDRISNGVILVENKKICAVGKDLAIPAGAEVIDASDKWVTPGLIDAHTHLSIFNEPKPLRGQSDDGNEMSDPVQPHLRSIDALNPFDSAIPIVRSAGFTTCYTGPGSGNVIGGMGISFKLRGKTAEEMYIPGSEQMKIALGENPKSAYVSKGRSPITRMGTAAVLREALSNAREYSNKLLAAENTGTEPPKYDFKTEALVKVVRGEMKVRIHCHRSDDIVTAVRVAEEFGLDYALEHASEGHRIAEFLGAKKATCVVGPLTMGPIKMEVWNCRLENPGILDRAGVTVCLTEDAGSATQWLMTHIGLCIARGLSEETAFRGVTVNPAKLLGLSHRIGSIEVGKDADFAIFDGYPFSNLTRCVMTIIEGEVFHS